jgi:hypothetical protein
MGKNYKKEIEHGFEKTFQKTNDFLKHKNTVIGLTILSVLCILWYSMSNQMVALVIFAVSGLITRLYIKSTGHVLMVAMVTTIIITSLMNKNIMEGLEGDDEEIDDGEEDTATASNGNITELPTKPKKVKKTKKSSEDDADEDTTETFEGVNAPSSVTNNNDDNYAPALDTKDLLKTQEKMIANMKTIEPMMTKAQNLLQMIGGGKAPSGKVKSAIQASAANTSTNASTTSA